MLRKWWRDDESRLLSSYLVEVGSRNSDLQVMDSVKLDLQTEVCDQKNVGAAADHLGSSRVNGNWSSHSPFIELRRDNQDTNTRQQLVV